ncbi:LADA_0H10594g1_1 [Lachancea dasiensis]|uniref:malate dehydrogenase n=1 Tax=Lachancea dasiensis TaxID=1072105 RepID=A0A1G4K352_9SACH|nr:LADA_0H10594g1_1 [Lachancea dasiensis]
MPHATEMASLKIAVLGAGGGIGQSLSLLLKTELRSTCLAAESGIHVALYDVNRDAVAGAGTDLSHINTPVTVTWHAPGGSGADDPLATCLRDAQLVVIPAGVPRKPGMTRDDLYAINARIVTTLAAGIAAHCDLSRTFVLLISNPVNSLVRVLVDTLVASSSAGSAAAAAQEVPRRVFGLTQLDAVRASTFLHEALGRHARDVVRVPVVGGHSGHTIVPLFSQATGQYVSANTPHVFTDELRDGVAALGAEALAQLVHRVQFGGDEVVKAKNGTGSATLSMAFAAAQVTRAFAELLLGVRSEIRDTLYANVGGITRVAGDQSQELHKLTGGLRYVSLPLTITSDGLQSYDTKWARSMTPAEQELWSGCVEELQGSVHEK